MKEKCIDRHISSYLATITNGVLASSPAPLRDPPRKWFHSQTQWYMRVEKTPLVGWKRQKWSKFDILTPSPSGWDKHLSPRPNQLQGDSGCFVTLSPRFRQKNCTQTELAFLFLLLSRPHTSHELFVRKYWKTRKKYEIFEFRHLNEKKRKRKENRFRSFNLSLMNT